MSTQLNLTGMSQYATEVKKEFQNSACGPTTIHVILKYLFKETPEKFYDVNQLYQLLGGTKIGLFQWRLIQNLQKLLGPSWNVSSCSLKEALHQLDNGRPVAMKFDQYFSFRWREKPLFKYHWVPLIGYEIKDNQLYLMIHDNGGRNRDSQIRLVSYAENYKVLSFVKIEPR